MLAQKKDQLKILLKKVAIKKILNLRKNKMSKFIIKLINFY
jgi:hypothetical protein